VRENLCNYRCMLIASNFIIKIRHCKWSFNNDRRAENSDWFNVYRLHYCFHMCIHRTQLMFVLLPHVTLMPQKESNDTQYLTYQSMSTHHLISNTNSRHYHTNQTRTWLLNHVCLFSFESLLSTPWNVSRLCLWFWNLLKWRGFFSLFFPIYYRFKLRLDKT